MNTKITGRLSRVGGGAGEDNKMVRQGGIFHFLRMQDGSFPNWTGRWSRWGDRKEAEGAAKLKILPPEVKSLSGGRDVRQNKRSRWRACVITSPACFVLPDTLVFFLCRGDVVALFVLSCVTSSEAHVSGSSPALLPEASRGWATWQKNIDKSPVGDSGYM